MALIEAYDEQYKTLVGEINAKIDRLRSLGASGAADPDAWASTVADVQRDLEDAEEVLAKISMETRSVKGDMKGSLQAKAKQYKIDLGICKETVTGLTAKRKEASERAELMSGASHRAFPGELSTSNEHRTRLSTATERMSAGTDRLNESRKIARETEMVAVDIMEDLRQQRETLLHARDSANEISENLADSRKFVKMIQRRAAQNKLFMYGVVAMVAVITITLIFIQLSPSSAAQARAVAADATPAPNPAADSAKDGKQAPGKGRL